MEAKLPRPSPIVMVMHQVFTQTVVLSGGSVIDLDGTFFIQLGIFLLSFVVLRGLVFRPLMRVFMAREAATQGRARGASDITERAAQLEVEVAHRISEAKKDAHEAGESIRREGQERSAEVTDRTRLEVGQHIDEAIARLNKEAALARHKLHEHAERLSHQIADAVLGRVH